jgi:FKBP12-rapamycin complex-associated protein
LPKAQIGLSVVKYWWTGGHRQLAYSNLTRLSRQLARALEATATQNPNPNPNANANANANQTASREESRQNQAITLERMAAKCWRKLGEWKLKAYQQLQQQRKDMASSQSSLGCWWGEEPLTQKTVLDTALAATSYDKNWHRAWHSWAMANLEFSKEATPSSTPILHPSTLPSSSPSLSPSNMATSLILSARRSGTCNPFIVTALQGFIRSVTYSPQGSSVQDSLRLLTLWFRHCFFPEVNAAVGDGISYLPIDSWLDVPQPRWLAYYY